MTNLSRIEGEALATAIAWLRPEWNQAGVLAALRDVAPTADKWDVYHAIGNIAADETVKTPGFLKSKGSHWKRPDGVLPARRGDHNVPCVDHPDHDMPCPACRDEAERDAIDPETRAELVARLKAEAAEKAARFARPTHPRTPKEATP